MSQKTLQDHSTGPNFQKPAKLYKFGGESLHFTDIAYDGGMVVIHSDSRHDQGFQRLNQTVVKPVRAPDQTARSETLKPNG